MKKFLLFIVLFGSTLHAISFKLHEASKEKQPFRIGLRVLRQMVETSTPLSDSERQELIDVLSTYDTLDWSTALEDSRENYDRIWAKADPAHWQIYRKQYDNITGTRRKKRVNTGETTSSAPQEMPQNTTAPEPTPSKPTRFEAAIAKLDAGKIPSDVQPDNWRSVVYGLKRHPNELSISTGNLTSEEFEAIINALPQIILLNIEGLSVTDCQLTTAHLGAFTSLQVLNVDNNQLTELQDIDKLIWLVRISANNNRLKRLPRNIWLRDLEILSLDNNELTEFSHFSFPQLRKLSLSNNKLTIFFDHGALPSLETLDIAGNPLKTLNLMNLNELKEVTVNMLVPIQPADLEAKITINRR